MLEEREAVGAHIEQGFAQAERGELIDGDAAIEMLRQRRAERRKPACMVATICKSNTFPPVTG